MSGRSRWRLTTPPVARSTAITRLGGQRFQSHMAWGETPTALARAAGPPATLMACSNAVSLFLRTNELKHCLRGRVKHCLRSDLKHHNQEMLDAKEVGRRIKKAMDEAEPKVTGNALAAACDVTPQAVSGWRKTGRVSKRHLLTLSRLTGKPLEYFIGEGGQDRKANNHHPAHGRPWLREEIIDEDQFLVVFRTWQDARTTDRQHLVAIAKSARKAHGARKKRSR
jgi:hypothetical protein